MHELESWRKSSYSGNARQDCVEFRLDKERAQVRDTKNRDLGHLEFAPQAWASFVAELKQERL